MEVGCGPVGFFESINGVNVTAVDTLMEAYARKLPLSVVGKVNNYIYKSCSIEDVVDKYDYVVCSNVLDHTDNWEKFLHMLLDKVKINTGCLLLYTHCRNRPSPGHTQVFCPSDIIKSLVGAGVERIDYFSMLPDSSLHANFQCFVKCYVD